MIHTENLTKIYKTGGGEVRALDDVSIDIKAGEFVAITGRSGSGKSTFLYQVGILDTPTRGKIVIDGTDVSALNDEERTRFRLEELGYVFQDYAVLPSLTALENVMLPLLMMGHAASHSERLAKAALEKVGLGGKEGNLPSQLSGGQQQRVAIARAIGHDPKIIFADEPTANLDSETSLVVLNVFKDLNREGQTIVMVTHEPEYAAMTHRDIELSDGKLRHDRRFK